MKIINVVGARPQFIKVCPILGAIEQYNRAHPDQAIQDVLVHTGQHYDYEMSKIFFEELKLKEPDYHLGVGSGTHAYQTGEMLKRVEEVLLKEKPDLVMVYGDTNTTLSGALAAAKLHILVAHVEAGLRSFNRQMPEEVNRVVVDHISHMLFCPTETAVKNLEREGISRGIYLVGDVMYDAVLQYAELAERKSNILKRLDIRPKSYALATVHRAENTDDRGRLLGILQGLETIGRNGLPVVFPCHPRTRKQIREFGVETNSLRTIEPVSYLEMLILEKNAKVILTDSGGVQKEAYFFGVPCITLREETEWVETVETGWNILAGVDPERIEQCVHLGVPSQTSVPLYADGKTAERIVRVLLEG